VWSDHAGIRGTALSQLRFMDWKRVVRLRNSRPTDAIFKLDA
jgi:hypothetical protein